MIQSSIKKKRLDVLLVEKGLAESRTKAQALIMAGQVKVYKSSIVHSPQSIVPNRELKPGSLFFENVEIEVILPCKYVSRGGEKLESALKHWNIEVKDFTCLDVGASTGGFTDCLLQNGAKKIYALDVGHGQMHPKLRNDPRVEVLEKTHILKWTPSWKSPTSNVQRPMSKREDSALRTLGFGLIPSFVTIDVSFISLKNVLARVVELCQNLEFRVDSLESRDKEINQKPDSVSKLSSLNSQLEILALIKPQFEVGQKFLKKGVVRDQEARTSAIEKIIKQAEELNLEIIGHFPCPVLGPKGNQEEWLYLKI